MFLYGIFHSLNGQRAANTGWGHEEDRSSKWDHDKFGGAKKGGTSFGHRSDFKPDAEERNYREKGSGGASDSRPKERVGREERGPRSRDDYERKEQSRKQYADSDYIREDKRPRIHDSDTSKTRSSRDYNDREVKGSRRQSETSPKKDRGSSYRYHGERDNRRR